ncbi:MAG: ATP-binding cassette domain-containing protein [Bacteroidales bacterium]|jgi:ABC-2 type transport system ATP-binding protein|nr:ATP-binding cassette domain-containing protein [Bacteroidales bacterium]MBO7180674.1 ATP-binding cassette domain-containing protein [Bacteroidales bacterium]MBQ1191991.1 ATP-binding cassette domain-containing protein [Bacteroidales bacterium]MBQ2302934.1 ATP-binding cassette domain-containing protein [Bacteroidales bacterium]MBQ2386158.1 ATP-binding cassette domain-containing protein [Bacteroidales bacterium]
MSIVIKNISKVYGTQKALDNVSLSIGEGEIVGLLGPNGAGKSTMMKILTCFIPPTEGSAEICGYDIFEHQMEIKRSVGYLSEQNPLYYDMYVREFLLLVAGIHKIERKLRKTRVEEVIALTGLEKEANKKIGTLSKGYKQRVGLAQALIHDPKVLILDEPTTGLDPNQLLEIRNLIKQIGQSKTILLSTHIMQEVEAVCSRVIIINNGRLVADDETKQLSAGGSLEKKFREITANI